MFFLFRDGKRLLTVAVPGSADFTRSLVDDIGGMIAVRHRKSSVDH
jgi:hypothetical protein